MIALSYLSLHRGRGEKSTVQKLIDEIEPRQRNLESRAGVRAHPSARTQNRFSLSQRSRGSPRFPR